MAELELPAEQEPPSLATDEQMDEAPEPESNVIKVTIDGDDEESLDAPAPETSNQLESGKSANRVLVS